MSRVALILALTLAAASAFAQAEVEAHLSTDPTVEARKDDFGRAITFGSKFFSIGEFGSALEQFSRADAILPNHPGVLFNTALALARLGRYSDAQQKLDTYRQLYPAGAEIDKVKALQMELDFERELQRKQQENQSYVEFFNRAKFAYDRGDYAAAARLFSEAEQQRPDDAAAVFNQALAFEAAGDYQRAVERLRKYQAIAGAAHKSDVDQKIFMLESEINDVHSSIVCSFCGYKLAKGSLWCPRCWHGPYAITSGVFNTRTCGPAAATTRTTYYANNRVEKNEDLQCLLKNGPLPEEIRYSRAKQRAIQQARRDQGWIYAGDVLDSFKDKDGNVIRLVQGESLEKLLNVTTGEVFAFSGRQSGGKWFLDSEEFSIDGQKFVKHYTYDANGRIATETVRYQNKQACGHVIQAVATYNYVGDRPMTVALKGGYQGYETEGAPQVEWTGTVSFFYDPDGRLTKEEFSLDTFNKTYTKKAFGPIRDQIEQIYPQMRLRKPHDIKSKGDVCSIVGPKVVTNPVDLRPFYSVAPDLAIMLPAGVQKVTVNVSYPKDFVLGTE